ncbi:hypothetical protein ACUUYQ_21525 [Bacillus halotolerans]|uniref:hypothetical protein n=1 Tax=Bacillus subtilis group TaxID=653685 RepID=UPI00397B884B
MKKKIRDATSTTMVSGTEPNSALGECRAPPPAAYTNTDSYVEQAKLAEKENFK